MNKKKFAVSLLLSAIVLGTTSMPSYAGIGTAVAEHIIKHFIKDAGLNVLDGIANAGLIELEPYEGVYTNVIMNDRDFKLQDSSLLIFPIMDVTNTSYGVVTAARDYFEILGRATVINYSNLKVNPNSTQDIHLKKR